MKAATRNCKEDKCKDRSGNCYKTAVDGFAVQCVGPWVENKYFFLERYLGASREARRKFADNGNAVFIDLFAGPGKCVIREENREIDNGGIRALRLEKVPFNEYFYFDINKTNTEALKARIKAKANCHIVCGDSNVLVRELVTRLQKSRYDKYHFAFIDPFGPEGLKFTTLSELAKLKRMDMLINFPIGAITRNWKTWLKKENTILDDFLGTNTWRKEVARLRGYRIFRVLIDIFKNQLRSIGYPEEGLKMDPSDKNTYTGLPTVPIKNTKEIDLYVLVLAAKHSLAQELWNDIIKTSPNGQKSLF